MKQKGLIIVIIVCQFSMPPVSLVSLRTDCLAADIQNQAGEILRTTGVKGGLVVHIGCGEGKLTAGLRVNDSYLVQGLDADAEKVEKARKYIGSLGIYGKVSVDKLSDNQLPYVDNLVNLVVAEEIGGISMNEVMRVLCPNGAAYVKSDGRWEKTVKPRPKEIDEWTHYLHDTSNNAVAHDSVIDLPRHLQWLGGPQWARHHDHMSSSSVIVSSAGRNFYIFDEGLKTSIQLPSKWLLSARDAFSGKILWKRPMEGWHTQMWRLKSGPAQLPRRLVAVGDTVYVTLSLDSAVTAIDAATGLTIRTYANTRATEEILFSDGVLFLVVNDSPTEQPLETKNHNYRISEGKRRIMAVQAETGKVLWDEHFRWIVPVTLTVNDKRVLFFDGEEVVCLDRRDAEEKWRSEALGRRFSIPSYFAPTLVVYEDVVLFSGSDTDSNDYHVDNGKSITAMSAESGKTLWTADHPPSGYRSPEDIFVINGLVWTDAVMWGYDRDDFPHHEWGIITGRDLHTGKVVVQFPPDVDTYWFHHRCYRAKATDKYLLTSRTGIEFVDYTTKHWICNHWVRGACLYGIMPANGMIYNAPHPCACYLEAKLSGFNALAPSSPTRQVPRDVSDKERLERGPAYGQDIADSGSSADWPTYRHDAARSGYTEAAVPAGLKQQWRQNLGGRLSGVVVAGGKLFVASVDTHTVNALDAGSGRLLWAYTAGSRVDSPPTIWKGRVLFGSADGYVYCLRASDGRLIWRFRAAPLERRLVAFEGVESVWPVHGSVLVEDNTVWCVAGRSMFLDGGLRMLHLDAQTGRKISEKILDERDPETGENLQAQLKGLNMPVALPDILSSDGKYVYMRSQRFDKQLRRLHIDAPMQNVQQQQGEGSHLFCPTGLLDDAYWHRSYWVFGQRWASGAGGYYRAGRYAPSGQMLVFDDSNVYGYSRKPQYFKWTTAMERQLFASNKEPKIIQKGPPRKKKGFTATQPTNTELSYLWTQDIPLYVRAMVLADKTLFVAGPPDIIDESHTLQNFADPAVQAKLAEQSEILQGSKGALLWAVSNLDGSKLAEYKLDEQPVFDGMAAAGGNLYVATTNGSVVCMKGVSRAWTEVARASSPCKHGQDGRVTPPQRSIFRE